jgi:predicted metal-dependent hydrolase
MNEAARQKFRARILEWAAKLEVKATAIYIRPMRRKWASYSTAGTLSFNDELISMPRALGDYVIVHELLHFSVPNHGKLWKSLMRAHLGPYEKYGNNCEPLALEGCRESDCLTPIKSIPENSGYFTALTSIL